jgi:tetratricopeptide (TPR) repeat protein
MIRAGRIDDAASALSDAGRHSPAALPWTLDWFGARVNRENGHYQEALESLTRLVETRYPDARNRGFDFSRDVRLLNELGTVHFALARREVGEGQDAGLEEANSWFQKTLVEDPENVTAHWNLAQLNDLMGNAEVASEHRGFHRKYKPDDSARDEAISAHRIANPPANHAASDIVIYDLQRETNSTPPGGR